MTHNDFDAGGIHNGLCDAAFNAEQSRHLSICPTNTSNSVHPDQPLWGVCIVRPVSGLTGPHQPGLSQAEHK
jgi:hypothetical protein